MVDNPGDLVRNTHIRSDKYFSIVRGYSLLHPGMRLQDFKVTFPKMRMYEPVLIRPIVSQKYVLLGRSGRLIVPGCQYVSVML